MKTLTVIDAAQLTPEEREALRKIGFEVVEADGYMAPRPHREISVDEFCAQYPVSRVGISAKILNS